MKKVFILMVVMLLVGFTGCIKTSYDIPPTGDPESVAQLKVPAGFDWKMSSTISCQITAPHPTQVFITDIPKSKDTVALLIVGDPTADQPKLSLPKTINKLYVRYEKANGQIQESEVPVVNGAISYNIVDSKKFVDISPLSRAAEPYSSSSSMVYIPIRSQGWGTVMFEDLWPSKGDYDFNDMAVNYKIQLYVQNKNMVYAMLIGLRVNAIGGSDVYNLYLRMNGVTSAQIDEIEPYQSVNTPDGKPAVMRQMVIDRPNKNSAIFAFDGIKENKNAPAGVSFFNTVHGAEVEDGDLVTAAFLVYFRNSIKLENVMADDFDFFIAKEDGNGLYNEIHAREFEPINTKSYSDKLGISEGAIASPYYNSKENLVWAINIPATIAHAYERTDFLLAYPGFAAWAQSGGTMSQDWYKHGVNAHLVNK